MKSLCVIALMLASSVVMADTSRNPDRVPSFGFNYQHADGTSDIDGKSADGQTYLANQYSHNVNSYLADVRVPVTNVLTLSLNGGVNDNSFNTGNRNTFSLRENVIGAGFRIYLQK